MVSIVDATGERTFLTSRGAEATLTAADLDPVRPAPGDAVYLSGYGLAHPSNATALPGFCLERRAAGISTDPTAATSAILEPEMPENSTIDVTITTLRPPRMWPTARCNS